MQQRASQLVCVVWTYNALSVQQLLGDDGRQATQQVPIAVDDDDLHNSSDVHQQGRR